MAESEKETEDTIEKINYNYLVKVIKLILATAIKIANKPIDVQVRIVTPYEGYIYLFDIPKRAQYIEIKVRYSGEGRQADFDDYEEIAGRVWIRNFKKESKYRSDDDDDRETLHGDTFVLRSRRRGRAWRSKATWIDSLGR